MHAPTERVIRVLEAVIAKPDGLRLTELSTRLGVPKSTLLPIVSTLCEHHYLYREGEQYVSGIALYALGNASHNAPMALIHRELEALSANFGETCYFGILEGGEVRYLDKVDSAQPLRVLTAIGTRLPAYATGLGKALLIGKAEAALHALYPDGLSPLTERTVTNVSALARQLAEAEACGYAWECEESTAYVRCLAVPVRVAGQTVAAISIAIPIFRYDESKKEEMIAGLLATSARLGGVMERDAGRGIWS